MALASVRNNEENALTHLLSKASSVGSADMAYAGDITPEDAFAYIQSNDAVIVDVRTLPEWQFTGLPDLSGTQAQLATISWKNYPDFASNPKFADQLATIKNISKETPLLFLCRSGGRSLDAALAMTAAGYQYCFNISDGFEGDPRRKGPPRHVTRLEGQTIAMETGMSSMALAHAEMHTMDDVLALAWGRISVKLNDMYGDAIFRSWLKPIQYAGSDEGKIHLSVPTRFMREWVNSHYAENIRSLWQQEQAAEGYSIEIIVPAQPAGGAVAAPEKKAVAAPAETAASNVITTASWQTTEPADNDLQMSAMLEPRNTFDNFVVGKPNELAHAAARRVAETVTVVPGCNPLFLYGGVGLGKTHLMHAIAWHIRCNSPERRVLYLSAEKFMYQFIKALRCKEAMAFKEHFRSVDVLMIDDVQFISGKDSTQEEFFHTFNALVDQNKQLIISGDRSPSDLEGIEERVRSRLGWGLVADIHATTYELRLGILQSKIAQRPDITIPQKVAEFLAHKITSNVRELEGALNRVFAHATLIGRPITLEMAQEVLHDLLRANDRRISIDDIQKQAANHYNIKVSDMHSARRSRAVARPRQVAMYLSKKLTSKSLPEIGRKFGGKDHTTVMHAVKRVEELMASDSEMAKDIELLERILQS